MNLARVEFKILVRMLQWFVICKYFSSPVDEITLPLTASFYNGQKFIFIHYIIPLDLT